MKKYLFLLIAIIIFGSSSNAQVLKKLKDKAKVITDQKTDAKANQVIGNGVDSVMSMKSPVKVKKKKKKNENNEQPADSVNTNPATSYITPVKAGIQRMKPETVCGYLIAGSSFFDERKLSIKIFS